MEIYQLCETTYRLNGDIYHASTRMEIVPEEGADHYRAVIEDSPLRGSYGGVAHNPELALDFLNLAMQAEGADEIVFLCHPVGKV